MKYGDFTMVLYPLSKVHHVQEKENVVDEQCTRITPGANNKPTLPDSGAVWCHFNVVALG